MSEINEDEIKRLEDAGKLEKQKYNEYLPEGFNELCEAIRDRDKAYSTEFGKDVRSRYDELRKDDVIPAISARIIVVGEFAGIRSERRLVGYLPDECKNHAAQLKADISNESQKGKIEAKRQEKQKETLKTLKAKFPEAEAEADIPVPKPIAVPHVTDDEDEAIIIPISINGGWSRLLEMYREKRETAYLKVNKRTCEIIDVLSAKEVEEVKETQPIAAVSPAL